MRKTILASLIAASLSSTASANPLLSYTFIEGGYNQQEIKGDNGKTEIDSWYTLGSIRKGNIVIQAAYERGDVDKVDGVDVGNLDVEVDDISLFIGGVRDIGDDMTLLIGVSYSDEDLDSDVANVDAKIYRFGGELRYLATSRLELNGSLAYAHAEIDDDDSEGDTELTLGLRYHITDHASFGIEYARLLDDSDTDLYSGNVRVQF